MSNILNRPGWTNKPVNNLILEMARETSMPIIEVMKKSLEEFLLRKEAIKLRGTPGSNSKINGPVSGTTPPMKFKQRLDASEWPRQLIRHSAPKISLVTANSLAVRYKLDIVP